MYDTYLLTYLLTCKNVKKWNNHLKFFLKIKNIKQLIINCNLLIHCKQNKKVAHFNTINMLIARLGERWINYTHYINLTDLLNLTTQVMEIKY